MGWGEVVNGGFGLVLDGSERQAEKAELMLGWDVSNGVSRRAWSGPAGKVPWLWRGHRHPMRACSKTLAERGAEPGPSSGGRARH